MRFSMVSRHLPEQEGTSPGRALWATAQGLLELGHELDVWCWGHERPRGELPRWCTWRPLGTEPWLRMKARALVRPRSDVVTGRWTPTPGALPVADDPVSFPAVAPFAGSVLTQHYLTTLDRRALRRLEA